MSVVKQRQSFDVFIETQLATLRDGLDKSSAARRTAVTPQWIDFNLIYESMAQSQRICEKMEVLCIFRILRDYTANGSRMVVPFATALFAYYHAAGMPDSALYHDVLDASVRFILEVDSLSAARAQQTEVTASKAKAEGMSADEQVLIEQLAFFIGSLAVSRKREQKFQRKLKKREQEGLHGLAAQGTVDDGWRPGGMRNDRDAQIDAGTVMLDPTLRLQYVVDASKRFSTEMNPVTDIWWQPMVKKVRAQVAQMEAGEQPPQKREQRMYGLAMQKTVDGGWLAEDMAAMMQKALDDRGTQTTDAQTRIESVPAPWRRYVVDAVGRFVAAIRSLSDVYGRQMEAEVREVAAEADTELTGANARLADANAQQAVPGTKIAKKKVGQKRREGIKPLEQVMDPGLQRELVALDRERDALLSVIEKDAVSDQPSDRERAVRVSTQLHRLRKERTALLRDHNLQVAAVAGFATAAGSAVAPVLLPSAGRVGQAVRNGVAANVRSLVGELSEMAKHPADDCNNEESDLLQALDRSMAPTQKALIDLATQTDATETETATTSARTDVKVTDLEEKTSTTMSRAANARTDAKVTASKKKTGVTRTRATRRTHAVNARARAKAADLKKKTDTTSFRGFCDTVWCKILAIAAIIASFFLFLGWKLGMCQKRVEG